mmetsp:Transcript_26901/g.25960  ORF Transcript_26901/g.25960 Transcript_26901/m.25960 type:complete len:103 (+) Transcript_26901:132-440(+)|eukprot:CAMPEP_0170550714 /NCGR_PEP_ID=MMETSP0211-20121228/8719_1 /TAXON_ID=311385 /ORGANISM="Pseudokeronopsis sp., Strain OXSARD2" /LENGTH=102 /DNA_ID=CAMNT_0010857389 /DNA_START=70 /DNA_END=378 /DNA_ORIENTATION=-
MKYVYLQHGNKKAQMASKNELATLRKLGTHQNIVKLIEYEERSIPKQPKDSESFVLLEYCPGGTLFDLIEKKQQEGHEGLDEETLLDVFSEVVNGIIKMHLE